MQQSLQRMSSTGRAAGLIGIAGILLIGIGSGALPVFAETTASDKSDVQHSTDVSKNPVTGNTTVTQTSEGTLKTDHGKRKYKKQTKRKYDKNGDQIDHTTEMKSSETNK